MTGEAIADIIAYIALAIALATLALTLYAAYRADEANKRLDLWQREQTMAKQAKVPKDKIGKTAQSKR